MNLISIVGYGVAGLEPKTQDDYIAYASLISIISGAIMIVLGLFKLGLLVNFLSHPVISGFTSASGQ